MVVFHSKYEHQIKWTLAHDINLDIFSVGLLWSRWIDLLSIRTSNLSERMENSTFCHLVNIVRP